MAGSIAQGIFGQSAAQAQEAQATQGINYMQGQQAQTNANLQPYVNSGTANLGTLQNQYQTTANNLTGAFNTANAAVPGQTTMASLVNSPSYQFSLGQGLTATQAAASARGLGISGASQRGAANFATGLASQQYQNIFNQQNQQYLDQSQNFQNANTAANTVYNQLYGPTALGASAGSSLGQIGANSANQIASDYNVYGAAAAGGQLAYGNAINNGLQTAGNNLLTMSAMGMV